MLFRSQLDRVALLGHVDDAAAKDVGHALHLVAFLADRAPLDQQQLDYGGRYAHSYMDALPDFVKLAEAYGHVGLLIEKPVDVEPALREAIRLKDRTVFLDVRTDPTENVWPMVKAGQGITEMLLGSEDL